MNLLLLSACKHGIYGVCKKCDPKIYKEIQKHLNRKFTKKELQKFKTALQKIRGVMKDE